MNSIQSSASTHFESELKQYQPKTLTNDELKSVTKRLVFAKPYEYQKTRQSPQNQYKKQKDEKIYVQIAIAICILIGSYMIYKYSKPKYDLQQYKTINQDNVENLFDPDQLTNIKSYQEVASAKYYYYDLIGKLFKTIPILR